MGVGQHREKDDGPTAAQLLTPSQDSIRGSGINAPASSPRNQAIGWTLRGTLLNQGVVSKVTYIDAVVTKRTKVGRGVDRVSRGWSRMYRSAKMNK